MINSRTLQFFCVTAMTSAFTFSCKPADVESEIRVVGGTETSRYPAVVKLGDSMLCTGTFIASNAILTAGHCSWEEISYENTSPNQNIPHPNFSQKKPGRILSNEVSRDLRILIFDVAVSKNTLKVSATQPRAGDTATIVGFGCDNFSARKGYGTKRVGTIEISEVTERALVLRRSATHGCPGDSGGPLLNTKGQIIGVTSIAATGYTEWVNLNTGVNRQFIATGLKKSASLLKKVQDEGSEDTKQDANNSTAQNVAGQGTTPSLQQNSSIILDCNKDLSKIRSASGSGICRNSSSRYCYRYDRGKILYDRGNVQCPAK